MLSVVLLHAIVGDKFAMSRCVCGVRCVVVSVVSAVSLCLWCPLCPLCLWCPLCALCLWCLLFHCNGSSNRQSCQRRQHHKQITNNIAKKPGTEPHGRSQGSIKHSNNLFDHVGHYIFSTSLTMTTIRMMMGGQP